MPFLDLKAGRIRNTFTDINVHLFKCFPKKFDGFVNASIKRRKYKVPPYSLCTKITGNVRSLRAAKQSGMCQAFHKSYHVQQHRTHTRVSQYRSTRVIVARTLKGVFFFSTGRGNDRDRGRGHLYEKHPANFVLVPPK